MKKEMEEQRQKDLEESKLTEEQKIQKHEIEMYELEKKILRENVIRDKVDYLKKKVEDLVAFLDKEGVKTVNSVPLKDIWTLNDDVESVYFSLKDIYDDINEKKQDEANMHANKALNELDLYERASRVYEVPKLKAQLKVRNETEIADLKKYLEDKHSNDLKIKHQLEKTSESLEIYRNSIMDVRRQDLAAKMEEFKAMKTNEIKQAILNRAIKKFRVDDNKRLIEEKAKERAAKAAQIGSKLPSDKPTSDESGGFTRKGFGTEKPVEQPDDRDKRRFDSKPSTGPKTYGRAEGMSRNMFGKGEVQPDSEKKDDKTTKDSAPKATPAETQAPKGAPKFSNTKKADASGDMWRNKSTKVDDKPNKDEGKKEEKKEDIKKVDKKKEETKSKPADKKKGGRFDF